MLLKAHSIVLDEEVVEKAVEKYGSRGLSPYVRGLMAVEFAKKGVPSKIKLPGKRYITGVIDAIIEQYNVRSITETDKLILPRFALINIMDRGAHSMAISKTAYWLKTNGFLPALTFCGHTSNEDKRNIDFEFLFGEKKSKAEWQKIREKLDTMYTNG